MVRTSIISQAVNARKVAFLSHGNADEVWRGPRAVILHEVSKQLLSLRSRASLRGLLSHHDGQGSPKSAAGPLRHGLESARVVCIPSSEGEVTGHGDWAEGLGSPALSAPK